MPYYSPPSPEEIENKARDFRRRLGVDGLEFFDVPTLVFKACKLLGLGYSLVTDQELPEPGGRWDAERKLFLFRQSVFEAANSLCPDPRARWTIVHEIIHALNGDKGIRNRSPVGSLEKKIQTGIRAIEAQTDRLTASFFAPYHLIHDDESASSIARRFGMGMEAATIRAAEVAKSRRRELGIDRPIPESIRNIIEDLKSPKH